MTHDTTTTHERARLEAELESKRTGFRYHVTAYILANLVFLAWDVFYVPEAAWAHWPILGWGAGLVAHYLGGPRLATRRLEARA